MPRLLPLLALALLAGAARAQAPAAVTGTVVDADGGAPLPGATVVLLPADTTAADPVAGAAAGLDGTFRLEVAPGAYRLRVSFVGYVTAERGLDVSGPVALGSVGLEADAEALGDVEVEAVRQRVEVRGDTTAFNADAFPVNPDATAGDLLRKLPGVTDEDGEVKAEGETVQRVLVDGREFFGTDVRAALETLPAEIVQEVQVFDRQSDEAQFSGFDDGNAEKTINIVTRPGMSNGQFGRAYAGAGPEGAYLAGGNVTVLDGDRRVTVVGLTNNVDQQNFATEDLLGAVGGGGRRGGRGRGGRGGGGNAADLLVDDTDGVHQTTALGVSVSDRLLDGDLELEGSYVFNTTETTLDAALTRSYLTDGAVSQLYDESELSEGTTTSHRLSLRAEADLSERTQLVVRPRLSTQATASDGTLFGLTALPSGALLAETVSADASDFSGLSGGLDVLLRHRFEAPGRTVSLGLEASADGQDGERTQAYSVTGLEADDADVDQLLTTDALSRRVGGRLSYTEPLGGGQLQLSYTPSYSWGSSDRLSLLADGTGAFVLPDSAYSSLLDQRSLVQRAGLAYRIGGRGGRGEGRGRGEGGGGRRGGSGLSAQLGLDVQHERLEAEQALPTTFEVDRTYWSVLPSARLRYGFESGARLSLDYRARTQTPSATQLQDVVDNGNPLLLTTGNPDLQPSTTHTLRARFNTTDPDGGSVLFGFLSGTYGQNAIVTSTTLATTPTEVAPGVVLPAGAQLTRPVNLDGYWNARALATYGRPVPLLKSNANVSLGASYTSTPGLVGGAENVTDQLGLDGRLFLGSAVSERLDFSLEYGARYTSVANSAVPSLDDDYVRHQAGAELTWLPGGRLVLATDLRALHYAGLDASVDPTQLLWGARVGYKFLDGLAEVSLTASDLLDQRADVERTVTELYVEDAQTAALGRTVLLNLSYKLRTFGR